MFFFWGGVILLLLQYIYTRIPILIIEAPILRQPTAQSAKANASHWKQRDLCFVIHAHVLLRFVCLRLPGWSLWLDLICEAHAFGPL